MDRASLLNTIREYRYHYQQGNPLISDEDYDALVESYIEKYGEFDDSLNLPYDKVILPFYMSSINKIRKSDENKWNRFNYDRYVISSKINGISALYCEDKLYTKGDGKYGRDISKFIKALGLPKLEKGTCVRGELIILNKDIEGDTPSNNIVSGAFNRKRVDPIIKKIKFYGYRYFEYDEKNAYEFSMEDQYLMMEKLKFNTPKWEVLEKKPTLEELSEIYKKYKKEEPYDIDGLIIAADEAATFAEDKNPKHIYAFKEDLNRVLTTVTDIEWNVNRFGVLTPVIIFDPVVIDGTNICKASGYNGPYIMNNGIGIGSKIIVVKSGGIIPKVETVIEKSDDIPLPEGEIIFNDKNFILKDYQGDGTFVNFVKVMEYPSLGPARAKKLYNEFKTIKNFLNASLEDLQKVVGDKVGKLTFDHELSKSKYKWMKASGLWSMDKKLKQLSDIDFVTMYHECPEKLDDLLTQLTGIRKTSLFTDKIEDFENWINEIGITFEKEEKDNSENKTFVVTGGTKEKRKPLIEKYQKQGYTLTNTITKNTDLVIAFDKDTSKYKKAEKYGLKIIYKGT